jgi:branched-chain amino acid transport system substrate-binding protein
MTVKETPRIKGEGAMILSRRLVVGGAPFALVFSARGARAERPLRIGVLTDLSGPYRDTSGPTSVACVNQAVEDFRAMGGTLPVEVLAADHQNKADIGSSIARAWIDNEGVDAIADVPNSAVALAVAEVVREKDKVLLEASATTVALTGAQCSPNTVLWSLDTYLLAHATGSAMVRAGGDRWFFITADYTFGHSLEEETAKVVTALGGRVLGRARYPFPATTDFSSYLAAAQASGAKVVGFANAGADLVNCVKQAHEFGLPRSGIRLAPLEMFLTDAHALEPQYSAGLVCSTTFYWDLNEHTRRFAAKIAARTPKNWPNMIHASAYAVTLHYLKAAAAMGISSARASGRAVVERMKAMPTEDDAFGQGAIRADGRGLFPAYLVEVKKPEERRGEWDLYHIRTKIGTEEVVHPLGFDGCKLGL